MRHCETVCGSVKGCANGKQWFMNRRPIGQCSEHTGDLVREELGIMRPDQTEKVCGGDVEECGIVEQWHTVDQCDHWTNAEQWHFLELG